MDNLDTEQHLLLEKVVTSLAIRNDYGIIFVHPQSEDFDQYKYDEAKEEEELKGQEYQFNSRRDEWIAELEEEHWANYDGIKSQDFYDIRDTDSLRKLTISMHSVFHPGPLNREDIISANAVRIAKIEMGIPGYLLDYSADPGFPNFIDINRLYPLMLRHVHSLDEINNLLDDLRMERVRYLETGVNSFPCLEEKYPEFFGELEKDV